MFLAENQFLRIEYDSFHDATSFHVIENPLISKGLWFYTPETKSVELKVTVEKITSLRTNFIIILINDICRQLEFKINDDDILNAVLID